MDDDILTPPEPPAAIASAEATDKPARSAYEPAEDGTIYLGGDAEGDDDTNDGSSGAPAAPASGIDWASVLEPEPASTPAPPAFPADMPEGFDAQLLQPDRLRLEEDRVRVQFERRLGQALAGVPADLAPSVQGAINEAYQAAVSNLRARAQASQAWATAYSAWQQLNQERSAATPFYRRQAAELVARQFGLKPEDVAVNPVTGKPVKDVEQMALIASLKASANHAKTVQQRVASGADRPVNVGGGGSRPSIAAMSDREFKQLHDRVADGHRVAFR